MTGGSRSIADSPSDFIGDRGTYNGILPLPVEALGEQDEVAIVSSEDNDTPRTCGGTLSLVGGCSNSCVFGIIPATAGSLCFSSSLSCACNVGGLEERTDEGVLRTAEVFLYTWDDLDLRCLCSLRAWLALIT